MRVEDGTVTSPIDQDVDQQDAAVHGPGTVLLFMNPTVERSLEPELGVTAGTGIGVSDVVGGAVTEFVEDLMG